MWLVADSGSTKTEWILFDEGGIKKQVYSDGLNPLFLSKEDFITKIIERIPPDWKTGVTKLWFYGAGCGTKLMQTQTHSWLAGFFTQAIIAVYSDLLAAARATCGTSQGLVAILGTGSNSCFFDGNTITEQIKPLGFILGDEGSGAALGKALLKKLLRNQFTFKLTDSVYQEIGLNYDEIINKVYYSQWPNRFLASCAKVLYNHKSEQEILAIITTEFDSFSDVLKRYEIKLPVHIIGSVGYYFEKEIGISLQKQELEPGVIIKSPAKALVSYHLEND